MTLKNLKQEKASLRKNNMKDLVKVNIIKLCILMMHIDNDIDDSEVDEIFNILNNKLEFDLPEEKLRKFIFDVSSDYYENDLDKVLDKITSNIKLKQDRMAALEYLNQVMDADGVRQEEEKNLIERISENWQI